MSHLSTTAPQASLAATADPKLSGAGDYKPWLKNIKQKFTTLCGATGQNLLAMLDNNTETPMSFRYPLPSSKPSEFDVRINPVSKLPVASGELLYARELPAPVFGRAHTLEELFEMPLTKEAQAAFDKAEAKYDLQHKNHHDEANTFRKDDDRALAFVMSTITSSALSILQTNAEMKFINDDPSYFYRTRNLLKIINRQFATGNSSHLTNNLLALLNFHHIDGSFAVHLDSFNDQWNHLATGLEDPDNPGYIKLSDIQFILLMNSLNRSSPQSKQAINNYFTAYPDANSFNPGALLKLLIDQHLGNLADLQTADPISEQGSALIASNIRPYGAGDPKRDDHCKNCYDKTKGITKTIDGVLYTGPFKFYHKICHRNAREEQRKAKRAAAALLSKADATSADNPLSIYMAGMLAGQQQATQQQDGFSVMSQATTQP